MTLYFSGHTTRDLSESFMGALVGMGRVGRQVFKSGLATVAKEAVDGR